MHFEDILYVKNDGIATITINRPEKRNAFRTLTVDELIAAFQDAWWDHAIGVVIFTGAGDKAFCVGSDLRQRNEMTKEQWLQQRADFDQLIDHRLVGRPILADVLAFKLDDLQALKARRFFGEASFFVDCERNPLLAEVRDPNIEVIRAVPRRGVHEAGAGVVGDMIAGKQWHREIIRRGIPPIRLRATFL